VYVFSAGTFAVIACASNSEKRRPDITMHHRQDRIGASSLDSAMSASLRTPKKVDAFKWVQWGSSDGHKAMHDHIQKQKICMLFRNDAFHFGSDRIARSWVAVQECQSKAGHKRNHEHGVRYMAVVSYGDKTVEYLRNLVFA
jgi:hypothetical protein